MYLKCGFMNRVYKGIFQWTLFEIKISTLSSFVVDFRIFSSNVQQNFFTQLSIYGTFATKLVANKSFLILEDQYDHHMF